jgi:hypothetical protein
VLILPLLGEKERNINSRRIDVCSIIFSPRVIGFLPRQLLLPSDVVLAMRITFFWPVEWLSFSFIQLLTFVRTIALQRKGRAFSYMRDLIAVLNTVAPRVLEHPHFLERCLLLDGVPASVSPCDLIQSILGVQTAVLVRDSQTGFRIGLLVFFDAIDSAALTIQTPREGLYATCTPVSLTVIFP